jgi:hypothetical protein
MISWKRLNKLYNQMQEECRTLVVENNFLKRKIIQLEKRIILLKKVKGLHNTPSYRHIDKQIKKVELEWAKQKAA